MSAAEVETPVLATARSIAWTRRRKAVARFITTFATHRTGMFGVGILVFFIIVALAAPLIFPDYLLDPNANLSNDDMAPPSSEFYYWLGTDDLGSLGACRARLGRQALADHRDPCVPDGDGDRHTGGHRERALPRALRWSHGAADRLVPRSAVRSTGHRACRRF